MLKVRSFQAAASGILLLYAESPKGKIFEVYMPEEMLQELADGFVKTEGFTSHLGHRVYHIQNKNFVKCSSCERSI